MISLLYGYQFFANLKGGENMNRIFLGICGLLSFLISLAIFFYAVSFPIETEIKTVNFTDHTAKILEERNVQTEIEKEDIAPNIRPMDSRTEFIESLSAESLVLVSEEKDNHELRRIYNARIENGNWKKYIEKFSYQEGSKKFQISQEQKTENEFSIIFFHNTDKRFNCLVIAWFVLMFGFFCMKWESGKMEKEIKKNEYKC